MKAWPSSLEIFLLCVLRRLCVWKRRMLRRMPLSLGVEVVIRVSDVINTVQEINEKREMSAHIFASMHTV